MNPLFRSCLLAASLLSITCGCALTDRLDTMIVKLDQVRTQLYGLDETNERLHDLRSELIEMKQSMSRLDSNMAKMVSAFDEDSEPEPEPEPGEREP